MTLLVDQPIAAGSTLYPRRPLASPGERAAEDFYLRGSRPTRRISIQVTGPDGSLRRSWLASYIEEQINLLLQLQPGWDGRGGQPPRNAAVDAAVRLLFAVADDLSLPPQVFPLADGGLQLEWHAGESVEIEVGADGAAHALATDAAGALVLNQELEPTNGDVIARLQGTIRRLSLHLAGSR